LNICKVFCKDIGKEALKLIVKLLVKFMVKNELRPRIVFGIFDPVPAEWFSTSSNSKEVPD